MVIVSVGKSTSGIAINEGVIEARERLAEWEDGGVGFLLMETLGVRGSLMTTGSWFGQ